MASANTTYTPENVFTVQFRVLHALILRELKARYGNRRLGFAWALIEPLLFMSVFVVGFQLLGRTAPSGIPIPLFFAAGFSPFLMFRDILSEVSQGTRGQQSLLMFPQVTRMDLIIAKVVVNALVSISVFLLLVIGMFFIGITFQVEDPLGVMIGFGLMIVLGFGLGLVLGAISIRYEFLRTITEPLMGRPLFLSSGLFFTAGMLPPVARDIALYNPLLHCTELIRTSLFESFSSRYIDLGYVCTFALVLVGVGLMMLVVFERQRR